MQWRANAEIKEMKIRKKLSKSNSFNKNMYKRCEQRIKSINKSKRTLENTVFSLKNQLKKTNTDNRNMKEELIAWNKSTQSLAKAKKFLTPEAFKKSLENAVKKAKISPRQKRSFNKKMEHWTKTFKRAVKKDLPKRRSVTKSITKPLRSQIRQATKSIKKRQYQKSLKQQQVKKNQEKLYKMMKNEFRKQLDAKTRTWTNGWSNMNIPKKISQSAPVHNQRVYKIRKLGEMYEQENVSNFEKEVVADKLNELRLSTGNKFYDNINSRINDILSSSGWQKQKSKKKRKKKKKSVVKTSNPFAALLE